MTQIAGHARVLERDAQDTLTAVELDHGDTLRFTLRNGEVRTFTLLDTHAAALLTNQPALAQESKGNTQTIYHFTCRLEADGQPITLERYVACQEAFYEPYVINGVRLWFDAVADIFGLVKDTHGGCAPNRQARFALCDATDRICPGRIPLPCPTPGERLDIAETYDGDDCWMGPYHGFDAHGGLDLNMPPGTPNWAPFEIDDHWLFDSLAAGDNNNRWRGEHRWPNGDVWTWQNHHLTQLLVPEHQPIARGQHYAAAAGVHSGNHHHAHYVFRIRPAGEEDDILLDPWIVFWQAFEDRREALGERLAVMAPAGPVTTGQDVRFEAAVPPGREVTWAFGDGGATVGLTPAHCFARAGVYPVTLYVHDGARLHSTTQLVTVSGEPVQEPVLALQSPATPSFRPRPAQAMDVYGDPPRAPHTIRFTARASRPRPASVDVVAANLGGGELPAMATEVVPAAASRWLHVETIDAARLTVSVDATDLPPAEYRATIFVTCEGARNPQQSFEVVLNVPLNPPRHGETRTMQQIVVDDADPGCEPTPWFWVGPRFARWTERGVGGFYLTNGGRAIEGEYVRFTPDLAAGRYQVVLPNLTPYEPERRAAKVDGQSLPAVPDLNQPCRFAVRVRHRHGQEIVWMEPAKSRVIGEFEFEEGTDGFVEILAGGSTGQVLADAVIWKRL